jgi:hypothetical protein
MRMWKENENNTTLLLFSLKVLEILHQERRGQVKSVVKEQFNSILFYKTGPANKQHINQPTILLFTALKLIIVGFDDIFNAININLKKS